MIAAPSGHSLDENRSHLFRLPDLAGPVLQFDLATMIQQLRNEESWQRETGRSSKTLVKQQDFRIILILMKAGTRMGEHGPQARISIHTIQGRMRIHLPDRTLEIPAGQLLALDSGIRHDIESMEESAFLLTISWPKGYTNLEYK